MPGILGGLPDALLPLAYLLASVCFIHGLREMTHPLTARRGNLLSAGGMALAVGTTVLWYDLVSPAVLAAALLVGAALGTWLAFTVETTAMPQLVGLFNGFGGGASALVAGAELVDRVSLGSGQPPEVTVIAGLAGAVGALTFWGSMVAAGKLQGLLGDRHVPGKHAVTLALLAGTIGLVGLLAVDPAPIGGPDAADWVPVYWLLLATASVLGVVTVWPIGGADMPVVISLLNACSGLAAATTGFVLDNDVLIVAGTLVGAAGLILTLLMCDAMNRSLPAVLAGGFGGDPLAAEAGYEEGVMATSEQEVAILLDAARRVVIVPGYGMAVAQAQHAIAELARLLEADGVEVAFGIHPVAGRLPGHMNVLLAEANVPYEQQFELSDVNPTFPRTDVVLVVGANDVVNPVAESGEPGPIAGMPVLRVWESGAVVVNKRSLSPGYAGISNPLFTRDNAYMLFGDARESMQGLVNEYKTLR